MPSLRGVTSSGKRKKPNKRQRRKRQAQAASVDYVEDTKVEACSWKPTQPDAKRVVCQLVNGKRIWKAGARGVANLQPIGKAKRQRDDDMDKANGTAHGVQEVVKLEHESCKSECGEGEGDDIDEENNDGHIIDKGKIERLSRRMSKFLRHTAHEEGLLLKGDWLKVSHALTRLECNEAELFQAVKLSDRNGDDPWGLGPRFQMIFSGSTTWIRATHGEYYRNRTSTVSRRA